MKNAFFRVVLLGSMLAVPFHAATAHEMFLKMENYFMAPDTGVVLKLLNGTFDESLNAIARERMLDVSLVYNGQKTHPPLSAWHDSDNISFLTIETKSPGTYVAGVSLRQNMITLSAEDFAAYLEHDGILDTLAAFKAGGSPGDVRERYSKHVTIIFQVGNERSNDFSQALGYPIEIVLKDNPYGLMPGEGLDFQVLYEGKPVGNQLVYAGYQGFVGENEHEKHAVSLRTDENGMAGFVPETKGIWYISLIHMKMIDDPDADYQSDWGTLTFEIR